MDALINRFTLMIRDAQDREGRYLLQLLVDMLNDIKPTFEARDYRRFENHLIKIDHSIKAFNLPPYDWNQGGRLDSLVETIDRLNKPVTEEEVLTIRHQAYFECSLMERLLKAIEILEINRGLFEPSLKRRLLSALD